MSNIGAKQSRHLPAFLLLFLMDGEAHGGALLDRIRNIFPSGWPVDSGAVYRALRDLENNGSVTSHWLVEQSGPAKRVYQMTDKGKLTLEEWYLDISARRKLFDQFATRYDALVAEGHLSNLEDGEDL